MVEAARQSGSLITAHIAQFFFIDHAKAAIEERLLHAVGLDGDFTVHEQARFHQLIHEGLRTLAS